MYLTDTRIQHIPLAGTPLAPTIVLLGYLVLVFVILPRFMRNRPAYGMRGTILWYNALQVLFNAYAVYWVSLRSRVWNRSD